MGRRRATFATVAGTATNTIVVSVQAVVLIPLYLHFIGPTLYGAWVGSGDILVWLQAFDLGLPNLLIQRIGAAHARGDERTTAEYAATGIAAMAVVALAVILIGMSTALLLPRWFHLNLADGSQLRAAFQFGVIGSGLLVFNNSIIGFSRAIQKTTALNASVVVASVIGLIVSLWALLRGYGLWAITVGIITRSTCVFIACLVFLWREIGPSLRPHFRIRRAIMHEILRISPSTAVAGLSYAMMNQSEAAIAGFTLGPESVLVLTLTRKAAEVARGLLDVISYSSYGGFAHLFASDQRHRALSVLSEVSAIRWSAAVVAAAAFMAVDPSLVSRWVGANHYGGWLLTVAIATQLIVVGNSYLVNSLYRACGPVLKGSIALIVECAIRVPLMFGFLYLFGLVGLPLAGVITSTVALWMVRRWMLALLRPHSTPTPATSARVWVARGMIFAAGAALAAAVPHPTWPFILGLGAAVGIVGGIALLIVDPALANIRRLLRF